MSEYRQKYLKYKNKYLNLKKQIGGNEFVDNLFGPESDAPDARIFGRLGDAQNIDGIYSILEGLYHQRDNFFRHPPANVKVLPDPADYEHLPFFRLVQPSTPESATSSTLFKIRYCTPPVKSISLDHIMNKHASFTTPQQYETFINNEIKNVKTSECNYMERFISGFANSYVIMQDIKLTITEETNYSDPVPGKDSSLKAIIDNIIGEPTKFIYGKVIGSQCITIVKSENYLALIQSYTERIDNVNMLLLRVNTKHSSNDRYNTYYLNPVAGNILSENTQLKQLFLFAHERINGFGIRIAPYSFFHMHTSINMEKGKIYGVLHTKYELTGEFGSNNVNKGVFARDIQYNDNDETRVNLSAVRDKTDNDMKKEHNYLIEISRDNNVNIYKLNCTHSKLGGLGMNDAFFEARLFMCLNYYYDPSIREKSKYVILAPEIKPVNNLNSMINCSPPPADRLAVFGLTSTQRAQIPPRKIDNYITMREEWGMSHEDVIAELATMM